MQDIEEFIRENRVEPKKPVLPPEYETWALKEFQKLSENRLLTKFLKSSGCAESRLKALFTTCVLYTRGASRSTRNINVFSLRSIMQPSKWYYRSDEELPPRLSFTPKMNEDDFLCTQSIGHLMFERLATCTGIWRKYGFPTDEVKNIRYLRNDSRHGGKVFRSMPSFHVIRTLRNVINPDLWYIFPGEISAEDMRAAEQKADEEIERTR